MQKSAQLGNKKSLSNAIKACSALSSGGKTLKMLALRVARLVGLSVAALETLVVERVLVAQRVRSVFTFIVQGQGIERVELEVFDSSGQKVFHTESADQTLTFYGLSDQGRRLAKGVYLYAVTITGYDGQIVYLLKKLVILR